MISPLDAPLTTNQLATYWSINPFSRRSPHICCRFETRIRHNAIHPF